MTTICLEGTGASIAFGTTTTFLSDLISLTLPEESREVIDTTHLGTTVAKTSKPAKLKMIGDIQAEFDYNPSAPKLVDQAMETITINFPLLAGQTTPKKKVFTGYVSQQGGEEMVVDKPMRTKVTIKVSGDITETAAT